ncbi:hypothetical protein M2350_002872 [Candidatus Fervidibacter sacchari]|uniref:Uncharacterized protein n=1 Tax=Candidatus Fervidibacter sacchari TaxID=1448929 RepID=A0ABT2EU59_9BACT|nr:hypothetical protein [Candidatus Fervidibacter sacchari]
MFRDAPICGKIKMPIEGSRESGGDLGSTGRKVASVASRVAPVNSQPK